MKYNFNWQAFLASFSPFFSLSGHDLELIALIWHKEMIEINLVDLNVWLQTNEQWTNLFWYYMPMAIKNLAIVEHWNTLHYAIIWRGGH